MFELPNQDNPFKEQSELAIAWELGWIKRNESVLEHIVSSNFWSLKFRQAIRSIIFTYYPNNPCSGDSELLNAIQELVDFWKSKNGKSNKSEM